MKIDDLIFKEARDVQDIVRTLVVRARKHYGIDTTRLYYYVYRPLVLSYKAHQVASVPAENRRYRDLLAGGTDRPKALRKVLGVDPIESFLIQCDGSDIWYIPDDSFLSEALANYFHHFNSATKKSIIPGYQRVHGLPGFFMTTGSAYDRSHNYIDYHFSDTFFKRLPFNVHAKPGVPTKRFLDYLNQD